MNQVIQIARLTFSEALRNKIAYGMLAFIVMLLLSSAALASVTMGRTELMIIDLGLGAISIMGNLMAVVFTIQTLQQEKEGRTLYVLLTRTSSRWVYMLGKFLGLAAILGLQILLMCLLLGGFSMLFGDFFWLSFLQASFATVLEVWLVIAIAMIFAQTSSLFLAILLTFAMDVSGRFTNIIHHLGAQSDIPAMRMVTQAIYYLLPNFETINLRNGAGYITAYTGQQTLLALSYGVSEIGLLMLIAIWIFQRRNLT
ncbi:MAG: ABC transporter permease subunit [Mariprofundales bacterium]